MRPLTKNGKRRQGVNATTPRRAQPIHERGERTVNVASLRAFFARAVGDDPIDNPRSRRALFLIAALFAAVFFALSLSRYQTFHNHTFDLAFYARMSWGAARMDGWQPVISASVWGLHLVWIFFVLGWIGEVLGQVNTLLFTQALALGAAAIPLGRIATRHLGASVIWAAPLGALLLFLHPNTAHVAGGDFHPGTVAVLPIAWMMDALDRKSPEGLVVSILGVLACREDLGLMTALAAGLFALRTRGRDRSIAAAVAIGSLLYVAFFVLVLLPRHGPSEGSLALHFGSRGESGAGVVLHLLSHPIELVEHLGQRDRLLYLPMVLAPLAFLPLLAPELIIAAPLIALSLLSEFPTATQIDSHYLTPALPALVASSTIGLARVRARFSLAIDGPMALPLVSASIVAFAVGGGFPLCGGFDARAFARDDNTEIASEMVSIVGPVRSIQAPDALLAHFAARPDLRRAPPPEQNTDFVILELSHRRRLLHDEDLIRTDEEPIARNWLARTDHALRAMGGDYALLERDADPRDGIGFARFVTPGGDASVGRALCSCLAITGARIEGEDLELDLVARAECPSDLALRVGVGYRPRRVDLVAEGTISPAHLIAGDRIRSVHALTERERDAIVREGLRIGALRESGAPPEPGDPPAVDVSLDL